MTWITASGLSQSHGAAYTGAPFNGCAMIELTALPRDTGTDASVRGA